MGRECKVPVTSECAKMRGYKRWIDELQDPIFYWHVRRITCVIVYSGQIRKRGLRG